MASDKLLDGHFGADSGISDSGPVDALLRDILEDCLENIVHDSVLQVHREEKIARGKSAAMQAEQQAARQISGMNGSTTIGAVATNGPPAGQVTTSAGFYEDGKFTLVGNPLETTDEVLCPRCRLPRLFYPTAGKGAVKPDPDKRYCAREPPVNLPGHDIWGKPFPTDNVGYGKSKKDKKTAKDRANGRNSPNGTPPGDSKPVAASLPAVKCPNCPRYLAVNRIAQHLEKCMGFTGRGASRDAMAKMGVNGNGSTPQGSRTGTPNPTNRRSPKRDRDEDDVSEEEPAAKKKKKKVTKPNEKSGPQKLKISLSGVGKASDKAGPNFKKRERDEDADSDGSAPTKKRIKSVGENSFAPSKPSLLKQADSVNGLDELEESTDPFGDDLGNGDRGSSDESTDALMRSNNKQSLGTAAQSVGA